MMRYKFDSKSNWKVESKFSYDTRFSAWNTLKDSGVLRV